MRNIRANGKIVAEQDVFHVLFSCFPRHYCLKYVEQEVHRGARRQISETTNQVVRTTKPYQPIGSLLQDSEAVQANRIAPFRTAKPYKPIGSLLSGQRSRTSQLDRSFRRAKPYKPIGSLLCDAHILDGDRKSV